MVAATDPFNDPGQPDDAIRKLVAEASSRVGTPAELDDAEGVMRLLRVLQARNERLTLEVEQWQGRFAAQEARIAQLHDELDLVFRTRSWRLTSPLRSAQESLARSNSIVKLQALMFARRFLPRELKNAIVGVLGQSPPP